MSVPFDYLKPNWSESVTVTYSYRTQVFESRDGSEFRRAQRTVPRETITFTHLIHERAEYLAFLRDLDDVGSDEVGLTDFRTASVVSGHLVADFDAEAVSPVVATVKVEFELGSGTSSPFQAIPSYHVFDGREVMAFMPNLAVNPSLNFFALEQRIDYGSNRYLRRLRDPGFKRRFSATWLLDGTAEIEAYSSFYRRMAGRLGEFFYPVPDHTLLPEGGITQGQSTIAVSSGASDFQSREGYPAICLRLVDGRVIYRKVVSIASQAQSDLLTVDVPWSTTESISAITGIQWLSLARFGADELTLEYLTDDKAEAAIQVVSIPYVGAENAITDLSADGRLLGETYYPPAIVPLMLQIRETLYGDFSNSLLG